MKESFESTGKSELAEKQCFCPTVLFAIIFTGLAILLYIGYRAIGFESKQKSPEIENQGIISLPEE